MIKYKRIKKVARDKHIVKERQVFVECLTRFSAAFLYFYYFT